MLTCDRCIRTKTFEYREEDGDTTEKIKEECEWRHLYFKNGKEYLICPECNDKLNKLTEKFVYEIGAVYFVTVKNIDRDFLMTKEGSVWESM